MKAIVKATGDLIDVLHYDDRYIRIDTDKDIWYVAKELDFDNTPDYWEKLKHQYAGMAMQGMVRTVGHDRMYPPEKIAIFAVACATALVEKLKLQ